MPLPPYILLATSLGLVLSTTFTIGSLGFSYFAIPAILLPSDAPLFPPLALEPGAKPSGAPLEQAPKQPLDSGIGDEKEGLLDAGATQKSLRKDGDGKQDTGSPSSSSYLLRQWFHLFSKGMHGLPPTTIGSALCFAFCAAMIPSSFDNVAIKRALYAVAASLNAGAMVFTLTALKPTNEALHERVKEVVKQEEEEDTLNVDDKRAETEVLIRQWGRLNSYRAVLPVLAVVSAVVGLVA